MRFRNFITDIFSYSFKISLIVSGPYPNLIRLSFLKITGSTQIPYIHSTDHRWYMASTLSFSTLSLYVEISKYFPFFCQSSIHARSQLWLRSSPSLFFISVPSYKNPVSTFSGPQVSVIAVNFDGLNLRFLVSWKSQPPLNSLCSKTTWNSGSSSSGQSCLSRPVLTRLSQTVFLDLNFLCLILIISSLFWFFPTGQISIQFCSTNSQWSSWKIFPYL